MIKSLFERLSDLQLSTTEIKKLNPAWSDEMVIDYVNKSNDLATLAGELGNAYDTLPLTNPLPPKDLEDALRSVLLNPQKEQSKNDAILFMQPSNKGAIVQTVVERDVTLVSHNTVTDVTLSQAVDMDTHFVVSNVGSGHVERYFGGSNSFYAASAFTPSVELTSPTNIRITAPNIPLSGAGSGSFTSTQARVAWQVVTIKS